MKALPGPAYSFVTEDQLALLHRAGPAEISRIGPDSGEGLGGDPGCPIACIAAAPNGDPMWVDERGRLFVVDRVSAASSRCAVRVGATARIVAGRSRIWLLGAEREDRSRRLIQLDSSTLQLLIDTEMAGLTDIALDGEDGLWVLRAARLERMDECGAVIASPPGPNFEPSQIATAGEVVALLSVDGKRLDIFDPRSSTSLSLHLPDVVGQGWPGDKVILSGGSAFLLHSRTTEDGKAVSELVLIGRSGDLLLKDGGKDDRAPELVALAGQDLLAVFADAPTLRRFAGAAVIGGERLMTPALDTETASGTWLRAEVMGRLPEGATLAMRWASTADDGLRRVVETILTDRSRSPSARLDAAGLLLNWTPKSGAFTYVGTARDPGDTGPVPFESFAFPLHQAEGPILWVDLQLRSNGETAVDPEVKSLVVYHEAQSLMDDLPAIYRGDGDRDSTLRRLVGVIEATTQDIDRAIGNLAERLDPARTPAEWLPDLAAMLGLPFHEALSAEMQRRLVRAAAAVLRGRGTRAGLLAMLGALFPDRPIRVMDRTEQLIPVMLGGGTIPSLLAGASRRTPKLNARLTLGTTALCPADACSDDMIAPPPQVLVTIPASRRERRLYRDAVPRMIESMLPAGVRLRLEWTSWRGIPRQDPQDVLATIDPDDPPSLGEGPPLGRVRTGGRRSARLDSGGMVAAEHRLL
jgi:phage tail-like protein